MAFRSQTFVTALPGPRNSGRPASVKEKSNIRQAGSAFLFIPILADPLQLFNGVYHDMAHSDFIIADH